MAVVVRLTAATLVAPFVMSALGYWAFHGVTGPVGAPVGLWALLAGIVPLLVGLDAASREASDPLPIEDNGGED